MLVNTRRFSLVILLLLGLAAVTACGGGGSDSSDSSGTVTAPTITTQPSSQTVTAGSAASFTVTASGSGTLSYQWYKASSAISGATSSTYTIASTATSDAGSYYVTVSNSGGTTTSSTVTLTVSSSDTASCDTTYVDSVLSAVSTFEAALGSSLTASTLYSDSSYSSSQLNVYKTNWSNLPPGAISFSRPGITLAEVSTSSQISAFNALAKVALSSAGYADFQGVIAADDYLGYTKNANGYGADLYHVAFIGTPSQTGSWTLMLGGHHMAFNINFNGACAYPTPHHIGVEPRTAFTANDHTSYSFYDSGTYTVLADKAAAMVAIFSSMSSSELTSAFLSGQTFSDVLIGPVEANTGSYANVTTKFNAIASSSDRGLLVSSLSTTQQALVMAAIEQFTDDYDSTTASRLLSDYEADYGSTYVAWANASGSVSSSGPDVSANGTYMRVDGPRVWMEIAVQNGVVISGQTHYHMIYRDKTYDYYNQLSN
ncbi:MAG: hypothetical protein JWQ90_5493 [Hydrocarboniphaga sp.]|uniref:DUF3500 domain-containing protein n=1 Tax=Hydrocarboniphaga sp. TaxID=2033016 RepID=UPI00260A8273|nr:DUF3500 domain-containing protein [Hydrocarboniphaga sp.]MDB5973043.1 hypothetical protein [Hydrocarboniphaga sp.]